MLAIHVLFEGGEGGPNVMVGVLVFLLVFALMVLIGWWALKTGKIKPEEELVHSDHGHDDHGHEAPVRIKAAVAQEAPVHVEVPAAAPAVEPTPVAAVPVKPDDLVSLEGIGPKVAKLLNDNGIVSFAQLGQADLGKLRQILDGAGYKYMEPAGWVEQARLAAAGDAEGLKKLQDTLKGGRKVA